MFKRFLFAVTVFFALSGGAKAQYSPYAQEFMVPDNSSSRWTSDMSLVIDKNTDTVATVGSSSGNTTITNMPDLFTVHQSVGNSVDAHIAVRDSNTLAGKCALYIGGSGHEYATDVTVDDLGYFYVSGQHNLSFAADTLTGQVAVLGAASGNSGWAAKITPTCKIVWIKPVVVGNGGIASSIAVYGNTVYVGGKYSAGAEFGFGPRSSLGVEDAYIAALDVNTGTTKKVISFGSTKSDSIQKITVDNLGNLYVGGRVSDDLSFAGKTLHIVQSTFPYSTTDIFVAKFDKDLNQLAAIVAGGVSDDWVYGITYDSGSVYAIGFYRYDAVFGSVVAPAPATFPSAGGMYIAKLNASDLSYQDVKFYNQDNYPIQPVGYSIAVLKNNDIAIALTVTGDQRFGTSPTLCETSCPGTIDNAWVVFDHNFNFKYGKRSIARFGGDFNYSIASLPDKIGFITTGVFSDSFNVGLGTKAIAAPGVNNISSGGSFITGFSDGSVSTPIPTFTIQATATATPPTATIPPTRTLTSAPTASSTVAPTQTPSIRPTVCAPATPVIICQ